MINGTKRRSNILLDFFILFILTFSFTRAFTFAKASTFDDNLFPIYFILIIGYLLLCLNQIYSKKNGQKISRYKFLIFVLLCLITVVKTQYAAINMRHLVGNSYPVHDNPIQIEEAIKFLKQGKNPYTENYFGTAQEYWYQSGLNMALWHVVTLPFYLISSLIISYPAISIFGFYDQRMAHIICFLISIWLIYRIIIPYENKLRYLTLFIFNPFLIHFFIEGRNDIFVFTLIFLSLYLLSKKKYLFSSLMLGLAIVTKQSSWLLTPFYFLYIFYLEPDNLNIFKKIKKIFAKTWLFLLSIIIFITPFFIWDGKSFIEDVYLYPGGGLVTSYPISGLGISVYLLKQGIISKDNSYFPFWILQAIFGVPTLIFLSFQLKKYLKISYVIFAYTIFLSVFWLFSRFFMDNYVGYLSMLILMGVIFWESEKKV